MEWRPNRSNRLPVQDGFNVLPGQDGLFFVGKDLTSRLQRIPPGTQLERHDTTTLTGNNNIRAGPGDDTSPPNSVRAENINALTLQTAISAGWSSAPPLQDAFPSSVAFDVTVMRPSSIRVKAVYEFENHFVGQSMLVHMKVVKGTLCQDRPLQLIASSFHEFDGKTQTWIDITTDVAYKTTARAVAEAVIRDETAQQTAGVVAHSETDPACLDVQLGPISHRGRIVLEYVCNGVYCYDEMVCHAGKEGGGGSDNWRQHRICPLAVFLPWANADAAAGMCRVSLSLTAPEGASILPVQDSLDAYVDLKNQQPFSDSVLVAAADLRDDSNDASPTATPVASYNRTWRTLPPRPVSVLFWLRIPPEQRDDDGVDFVDVANELERIRIESKNEGSVVVQRPDPRDDCRLRVAMSGPGPDAQLYRIALNLPDLVVAHNVTRSLIHLTISDASGSTGIVHSGGGGSGGGTQDRQAVRDSFNLIAERRFLRRLSSVPTLVSAGILRPHDVWTDVFLAFDHRVVANFRFSSRVADLMKPDIMTAVNAALSTNQIPVGETAHRIVAFVQQIRALRPNGGTCFEVPVTGALEIYEQVRSDALNLADPDKIPVMETSFVDFDTDGGHNGGMEGCSAAISKMVDKYKVRNGVVTGFGAWVNQDCASRVAKLLGTEPAFLSLQVPSLESQGSDRLFRRAFCAWIGAIQSIPAKVSVNAGSISFEHPGRGLRRVDATEVVAAERVQGLRLPKFGVPDVSDVEFCGSTIEAVGKDKLVLYVASRIQNIDTLASRLNIAVNGNALGIASVAPETATGHEIAHYWMQVLRDGPPPREATRNPTLSRRLLDRFEDDLAFSFNIVTESTAYVGRSETRTGRPAIDEAHQPSEPKLFQLAPLPNFGFSSPFGAASPTAFGPATFSFGGLGAASSGFFGAPATGSSDATAPAPYGSQSFGAVTCSVSDAPAPASFGSFTKAKVTCSVADTPALASFGSFGAPAPASLFGSPAPFGAPAPAFSFGAPAPAFSFGARAPALFGAPSSGSFGSSDAPASAPFVSFRASAPASLFGPSAPAPAPFGASTRTTFGTRERLDVLAWQDILRRSHQGYCGTIQPCMDLLACVRELRTKILVLTSINEVSFHCDVCRRNFALGDIRNHCLACADYDECTGCSGRHVNDFPLHKMKPIAVGSPPASSLAAASDSHGATSLVSQILGPSDAENGDTKKDADANDDPDQSLLTAECRLRRFLTVVVEWWDLLLIDLKKRGGLPDALPAALIGQIEASLKEPFPVYQNARSSSLVNMSRTVVDSIGREIQPAST